MKQLLAVLLCLLLCGCAGQAPPAPPELVPEKPTTSSRAGLYDPQHPIEKAYPDLVRAYPLPHKEVHGVLAMGKDILILSGQGDTTLTLYTGDELLERAKLSLDFPLTGDDPSLQIHENGISFFDPIRQVTVLLDHKLQEIRQIIAPTGLSGKPILSLDGETVYYCTKGSVMAWNLGSGIRRTVKGSCFPLSWALASLATVWAIPVSAQTTALSSALRRCLCPTARRSLLMSAVSAS